ncbi:hypothetical protein RYX36_002613 [Vicia faba]
MSITFSWQKGIGILRCQGTNYVSWHTYELNTTGKPLKFSRKSLTTEAQIIMYVVLYNIRTWSYTSSIPVETVGLLSYMLDEATIDIARVISKELKRVDLSSTRLGDRIAFQLTCPGLMMGLCKKEKVQIPGDGCVTIKGMINDNFIERLCVNKQVDPIAEAVPVATAPPAQRR